MKGKQRLKLDKMKAGDIMEDLGVILETAKEKLEAGKRVHRVRGGKATATPTSRTKTLPQHNRHGTTTHRTRNNGKT